MTIRHHVSDELLFEYATGQLSEPWGLAVATHLALCTECRGREAIQNRIGGFCLDTIEPTPLEDDALAACLAMVGTDKRELPPPPVPAHAVVFPEPLRSYVGADLNEVRWSTVGGRVRQKILSVDDGSRTTCRLLYIPAGQAVPEHGHRGLELTLVLTGSFHDGGLMFRRGDLETADDDIEHMPIAGRDGPCVCLAVTDAPLRFKTWLPRLIQPFVRI